MPFERLEERTEPATPRRRQEARERGQVARSADLVTAVVLLGAVLALEFSGRAYLGGLSSGVERILGSLSEVDGERANLSLHFGSVVRAALLGLLPFVAVVVAAAVAANGVQTGLLWTGDPIVPRMERLNPVEGLRRILSGRAMARLLFGLLKLAVVAGVATWTIWADRERLAALGGTALGDALRFGSGLASLLSIRVVLALLILGIADYVWQRWVYGRDLRMTRAELREEMRRYEGDPKIRERRRAVQRQLALERMVQRVSRAEVVITNPTHLAVALEYDRERMDAPVVAAKGAEALARRIRGAALEHGVPVVERPDVARSLYRGVDVGCPIPGRLYETVAEVLAFVMRLKGAAA